MGEGGSPRPGLGETAEKGELSSEFFIFLFSFLFLPYLMDTNLELIGPIGRDLSN